MTAYDYTPVEELRELVRDLALRAAEQPPDAGGIRWMPLGPGTARWLREVARRDMLAHAAESYQAELAKLRRRQHAPSGSRDANLSSEHGEAVQP